MSDEDAFLHAIASAPGDHLTRLVYADWLDEHGEPARAAALRLDVEFAGISPPKELRCRWQTNPPSSEGGYPAALTQLSEVASDIPIDWLIRVTCLSREIRSLVDRFVSRVPETSYVSTTPDRASAWQESLSLIRQMFQVHVGVATLTSRFLVPLDYALFAAGIGGLACSEEQGMSYFDFLFDPMVMARETKSNCDMYAEIHGVAERIADCGLWLFVGYRDRHDYHLCCDRTSPFYGMIADMHDSHPWIGPTHGPGESEIHVRSFIDFLRSELVDADAADAILDA